MRVLKWAAVAAAVVIALLVIVLLVLRPPAPLASPQEDMMLAGVTIANPGIGRRVDQRITIHGSVIESIAGDNPGAPDFPNTRHFPGAYVLPGLIDMHVHHPPAVAVADIRMFELMYLAHGVTTVRDTGNFDNSVFKTRAQILEGDLALTDGLEGAGTKGSGPSLTTRIFDRSKCVNGPVFGPTQRRRS